VSAEAAAPPVRPPQPRGVDPARRQRIQARLVQAAIVRSRASAVMWLAAVAAFAFGILPRQSVIGITGAVIYLIVLSFPTLWVYRRLRSERRIQLWSLGINVLEIAGFTAVIHYAGGIEAANLVLIYAAMIAYAGVLGRKQLPFLIAGLCSLAFCLMVVAEHVGWLQHHRLYPSLTMPWRTQVLITLVTTCLLFIVASLASRAAGLLWRSRRSVERSEERFRTLAENVPGVVYMARPGPPPEVLYLGGLVAEVTGHTTDALLASGESLLDLCHPQDRPELDAKIEEAIVSGSDYVVAYRLRHADGDWRWVEERGRPIFAATGELQFLEGIILEITDRKLLEQEITLRRVIQQAAHEWRLTFDTVESPVLILDSAGRIRRLNRAARDLAGLSWEECEGLPVGAVQDGEPWTAAEALVSGVLESRNSGPAYLFTSSGDKNWDLSAILSPRFAEERVILIIQDVTRIVELEDSLRRGEKLAAMGALVGGVAHEVRNPLFGLSASLDAMRATFASDEELEPYLEVLRSQVQRMTDLMNGLLEYGRSAASERSLGSLADVIDRSFADCAPLAEERGVRLERLLELDGWALPMNREGLASLFTNLLSNALQHSPAGGRVVVSAAVVSRSARRDEGAEHWVYCTVRDSGPGFGEEALARACEPFFTRRPGGMGLGLAIAERIVEDHDGKLELDNRPEGGAEVRVRLPCVAAGARSETAAASR